MNRQRILSMFLAIASAGQLPANTGSGTLTLLPPATGVNRLNVTVTATSGGIPVSDTATTDVSGAIITSINANPTTGATTQLSITGGNLSLTDMNFVLRLLFVTVANINTTNMAGTAYTPSPPAPVTPAAGGGSFDASLHHLLLNSGTISGTALGNPVNSDFATAPIDGAGSGTGGITMVAGTASATHRTFDATVTIPVDFTDNRDLNGTPVSIRVQGTLKAAGSVQIPLFGIRTWTGLSGNLWSNSSNWDSLPVSGDGLLFSGTTHATNSNDLAADRLVAGISFSNTANGSNFNLSGNRVILSGNITASDTATSGDLINDTIALDLVLNADRTMQLGARHNLNLTGLVSSSGAFGLTKSGSGSLTLGGGNTYTGATRIVNGLVKFGVTNALPAGTALTIGAGTTVGGLELGTFSGTVASLAVTSNTASNNTLAIGTGKSLTVVGNFTVGLTSAANTTTKLAPIGQGTLTVTGGNIQIGGNTTANATVGNAATLDLSGLANFSYVNSAGTLRVGDSGGNTGTGSSTLILADTSAITAQTVTMNSPTQVPHTIRLGSIANTIHADIIQIGVATNRSGGTLNFNTATGTLTVRNTAGSGRANMTVGYGPALTAVVSTNTVDLRGHASSLHLGTLQIAGRTSTQAGAITGVFSFNSGTLDATGVTVGLRAGSGTNRGLVDGMLNLGGGTVIIGASGLSVATNTASVLENSVSGTVNISGGTATMGQTGGTSITLGSSTNTTAATTTATLNLTGGTLTVAGDIVKGSTTGTVNSTLRLSGSTLDMGGNDIGATGSGAITLTAEFGTLRNVASINGSGGLTKTTAGTLVLSGTNTYSGNTTVSEGTLTLSSANTVNDISTVTIAATGATLNLNYTGTERVQKLFIGVTELAPGVYGNSSSVLPVIARSEITGSGTLTVGPSYASWAADPLKGNIPGQPASGDFDNDGLTNIVEYALGKDPRIPSQPAGVLSGNVITYTKGIDAIANGDVSWAIETSETLAAGSWTEEPVIQGATISFTFTPSTPVKKFARLKVLSN